MKKVIAYLIGCTIFLLACWRIGKILNPQQEESEKNIPNLQQEESVENWQNSTGENAVNDNTSFWEEYEITFENVESTTDNPWGYTAGMIDTDTDGKCVFLTPNTSVCIAGIRERIIGNNFALEASIHPWVADSSDGVGVVVWYLDDNNEILQQESFEISSKESWQEILLSCEDEQVSSVKLLCNNGTNDDDAADWLIIKQGVFHSTFGEEDYVRSVTYFGDAWPINFWNSEMENIDSDFQQIKNDGFNSIIIVIPWIEFQNTTEPITYNNYAFDNLAYVMGKANEYGLDVYARVGYTWDYYPETVETYVDRILVLLSDEKMKNAWLDYCLQLYKCMSGYECFKGGFLTWEDFYGMLAVCEAPDKDTRVEYAKKIGYQDWMEKHYSLEEINERWGENVDSYEQIATPKRNEDASMEAFYEFYDDYLNTVLCSTQEVFPNISMEVRLDWDAYQNMEGDPAYYSHEETFACADSDFTSTMYGIPMGCENNGERIGYEDAIGHTEYILSNLCAQNDEKPVYIEQFLFYDNTPQFSYNAQIKDDEVGTYLENVSEVLLNYSRGYGVWTYRDYRNDMLYNSQFALGDKGWIIDGEPVFEMNNDSMVCSMIAGDGINQKVPDIRDHFPENVYVLQFDVEKYDEDGTVIFVSMGDEQKEISINGLGEYRIEFEKNDCFDLKCYVREGELIIDNLCLYSYVQKGLLYDEMNVEQQCAPSIRVLNEELDAAY